MKTKIEGCSGIYYSDDLDPIAVLAGNTDFAAPVDKAYFAVYRVLADNHHVFDHRDNGDYSDWKGRSGKSRRPYYASRNAVADYRDDPTLPGIVGYVEFEWECKFDGCFYISITVDSKE